MPEPTTTPNATPPSTPAPMPGVAAATTPAVTPAPSTPAPTDHGGSSSFEAEIGELMKPKAPAKPEAKPEGKADAGKKPAEAKPGEKPSESAKPKPDPWDDPKMPAPDLRKRLKELHGLVGQTKAEKEAEISKLNSRIAELDKRKVLTPEQEKRQADMENRVKELESELYARDWSASPDFKNKYEEKFSARAKQAVADVGKLTVKTTDAESGEEKVRQATTQDWMRVYNAPDNIEARRIARELFKEDADIMLEHRNRLNELREQADQEVADKRKAWEATQAERQASQKTMMEKFDATRQTFDAKLVQDFPDLFGEDPANPEANEAMKKGLEFVDGSVSDADKMPIETRAMRSALLRRWASVVPKMILLREKDKARIAELTEELAKYRKSEPGDIGEGGGETAPDEPQGSNALAAMLLKGK